MAPVFESIWIFNSKGMKLFQLPNIIEQDPIDRFIHGLYLFAKEMGDRRIKSISLEKSAFCVIASSINELVRKSEKLQKKSTNANRKNTLELDIDIIFVGKIHTPDQDKQNEMIGSLEKITKLFMKLDIDFSEFDSKTLYDSLDKLDSKEKKTFMAKVTSFVCK
jgi:hypothetical protein